jgi:hypothetical protein
VTAIRFRSGKATAHADIHQIPLFNLFQRSARRQAAHTARQIRDEAQRIVPVRTGELKRSIHTNPPRQTGHWRIEARVTASAPHARYVHEGTRPHIIRARYAQALHFRIDGRDIFTKSVHHPGTKPNPFLATAAHRIAARHH